LVLLWNLFAFIGITLVFAVPVVVLMVLMMAMVPGHRIDVDFAHLNLEGNGLIGTFVAFLFLLLTVSTALAIEAAVMHRTLRALGGGKAGIGACLARGLGAVPRLIGACILLLIAYGILGGALALVVMAAMQATLYIYWLGLIGFLGLLPFLFLFVVWWVLVPALADSGPAVAGRRCKYRRPVSGAACDRA